MPARFEREGVRFQYPDNWTIEEGHTDDGWAVTVQSPPTHTAFLMLSCYHDRPEVSEVLQSTVGVLRQEYPDLDSQDVVETIAHRRAEGLDVQFFSMDFTNSCWLRGLRTAESTLLMLCQVDDQELERFGPVFEAIRQSLEIQEP